MHQPLPDSPQPQPTTTATLTESEKIKTLIAESAVIIFSKRGCCMSHVILRLLLCIGVNPVVYEVAEDHHESLLSEVIGKLSSDNEDTTEGGEVRFPVVFIGGRLFGGLERIMGSHISGELRPILKQAGALWL